MILRSYIRMILESKHKTPQTIMYHGTSSKFLSSILKNGIQPNPKKKVWDKDEDAGVHMQSRASLEGSYWTSKFMTAYSSSSGAIRKFGGDRIIVCSIISLKSAVSDEDSIKYTIERHTKNWIEKQGYVNLWDFKGYFDGLDKDDQNRLVQEYAYVIHNDLSKNSKKQPIKLQLFFDLLNIFLLREMSYQYDKYNVGRYAYNYAKEKSKNQDEINYQEFEKNIQNEFEKNSSSLFTNIEQKNLDILDQIGRQYKKSSTNIDDFNHTARMLDNIGFSGRNRIVCILRIATDKNDLIIEKIYGEIPQNFINQWKQVMGSPKFS